MSSLSPTPSSKSLKLVIVPFGQEHDRTGFSCGNSYIDHQLHAKVLPMVDAGLTRAFVALENGTGPVLGFYAMNSHLVEPYQSPDSWETLILHNGLGGVPAVYISLFATRESYQGRGIGRAMMADALRRIKSVSQSVGTFAVVLDAADAKAFDFYSGLGFQHINDFRMFYPVSKIP